MSVIVSGLLLALALLVPGQTTDRIVNEAVIDAPVEAVWTAYTTKAGLESWMAPQADVELVLGGKLRTHFASGGSLGDPETIEHTILSFEPNRMLSMRVTRAPASLPYPTAALRLWAVVYFAPEGTKTRVTEVTLGFSDDPESQELRRFLESGNRYLLGQLKQRFAGTSTKSAGGR